MDYIHNGMKTDLYTIQSLDITHTYIQDIRVKLATPLGDIITLVDQEGGSDNDIRATMIQTQFCPP
jgi:subtilisin-like proprotein convertase family protein